MRRCCLDPLEEQLHLPSAPVDRDTGLICDQIIALNGFYAAKHYPAYLRRIRYRDPETGKNLVFLTNQFALPLKEAKIWHRSGLQNRTATSPTLARRIVSPLSPPCAGFRPGSSPRPGMLW